MKIDYTRYYRKWHPDTPEHREFLSAYHRRIFEGRLPAPDRGASILDVGCGSGGAIVTLKEMGYDRVSGIDVSEEQIAEAKSKGLEAVHVESTPDWLRQRAGGFDVLLALDVIEHIPVVAQLDFASALAAALKPGGRLLCTVPNANSVAASRWRYNDWTHQASFTEHSIDFLLFNAGFDRIEVSPIEFNRRPACWWLPISGGRHWWAFRFFRFWRRLQMMAELGPEQGRAIPLSLNLLAVAEKK